MGVLVGVAVSVGVGVGVKVGVGVYVGVAVGVRVILTTSTWETGRGSLEEKALDMVGVPYQVKNAAIIANKTSTTGRSEVVNSGFVLVKDAAVGCSMTIRLRCLGLGGLARILWIAQCIPSRARWLCGLISNALLRYSRLASGEATAASKSHGSSRSGAIVAAC